MKGVTPEVIAEVRSRAGILEVISETVVLKRTGKEYKGLCPFHGEKSPSFHVNPDKGIFKCFGCGEGGDVFAFVQKSKGLDFIDSVRDLAHKYGVKLVESQEERKQYDRRSQILMLYQQASEYYIKLLRDATEGAVGRKYLSDRGLSEETIDKFKLGYAPQSWDGLLSYLTERTKVSPATLEEAGLVRRRQESSGHYDLFRNRLMIPICDSEGRVIAFGGRTLGDDQVKYLNSPESPIYTKGQHLFAFNLAKDAIKAKDSVIVVEGYFDAITPHQYGFTNTVATLGTALTEQQAKLLVRYTESKRVYLSFDADAAGARAVERGIETLNQIAEGVGIELRVISVPGGKDPDECLRSSPDGSQAFQRAIDSAALLIDYQLEKAVSGVNVETRMGRIEAAGRLVPVLAHIKNAVARGEYIRIWAMRLQLREEEILSDVGQYRRANRLDYQGRQPFQRQGYGNSQGYGSSQGGYGRGYQQGYGNAPGRGNQQGGGYTQGYGSSQGGGYSQGYGSTPGGNQQGGSYSKGYGNSPGYQSSQGGNLQGGGFAKGASGGYAGRSASGGSPDLDDVDVFAAGEGGFSDADDREFEGEGSSSTGPGGGTDAGGSAGESGTLGSSGSSGSGGSAQLRTPGSGGQGAQSSGSFVPEASGANSGRSGAAAIRPVGTRTGRPSAPGDGGLYQGGTYQDGHLTTGGSSQPSERFQGGYQGGFQGQQGKFNKGSKFNKKTGKPEKQIADEESLPMPPHAQKPEMRRGPAAGLVEAERALLALYLTSKEDYDVALRSLTEDKLLSPAHQSIKLAVEGVGSFNTIEDLQYLIMDRLAPDPDASRALVEIILKAEEFRKQKVQVQVVLTESRARIIKERFVLLISRMRSLLLSAQEESEATTLQGRIKELSHLMNSMVNLNSDTVEELEELRRKLDAIESAHGNVARMETPV